ncbi:MAG TPA: circadian clock KaiB family protein [Thermodesulfobacteriota bacterium]|nr:circadian clock KaiB family protein [Thermodesulfobacteriota bacterium]
MTDRSIKDPPAHAEKITLRHYITGKSPNSIRSIANLRAICRRHFPGICKVEMIDVLKNPMVALRDGVYVSPTLIKISPPPVCKIIGDLSEERAVLHALGFEEQEK